MTENKADRRDGEPETIGKILEPYFAGLKAFGAIAFPNHGRRKRRGKFTRPQISPAITVDSRREHM